MRISTSKLFTALGLAALACSAVASPSVDPVADVGQSAGTHLPVQRRSPLAAEADSELHSGKGMIRKRAKCTRRSATSNGHTKQGGHRRKKHRKSQHKKAKGSSGGSKSGQAVEKTKKKKQSSSHSGAGRKAAAKANNKAADSGDSSDSSGNSSTGDGDSPATQGDGLFGLTYSGQCPDPDASDKNPNGSQRFLNCGLTSGGWTPPNVRISQLKTISAEEAVQGVFKACKPYMSTFKQIASKYGLPPVLIMSFALQESGCNPSVTGGNGEQGMMQITPDKCGGAPGGNCKNVWFNIETATRYFKAELDNDSGNLLKAMGSYNGWQPGLTVAKATAARWQGHCHAQNNLDYLYQMLNGWLLGKEAYSMGVYQNLKNC